MFAQTCNKRSRTHLTGQRIIRSSSIGTGITDFGTRSCSPSHEVIAIIIVCALIFHFLFSVHHGGSLLCLRTILSRTHIFSVFGQARACVNDLTRIFSLVSFSSAFCASFSQRTHKCSSNTCGYPDDSQAVEMGKSSSTHQNPKN